MMKKTVSLLICLLMVFGLAACTTESYWETQTLSGVSKVWTASDDDVDHDIGEMSVDDGWGSLLTAESGGKLAGVTLDLYASVYTFAATLLTDKYSPADKTVAAVVRALDADGVTLGERMVRACDFTANLTYKDFGITFTVPKTGSVTFEVYWPGYVYTRVGMFGYKSDSVANLPDFDVEPMRLLDAETTEELEYDDEVLYYFDLKQYLKSENVRPARRSTTSLI